MDEWCMDGAWMMMDDEWWFPVFKGIIINRPVDGSPFFLGAPLFWKILGGDEWMMGGLFDPLPAGFYRGFPPTKYARPSQPPPRHPENFPQHGPKKQGKHRRKNRIPWVIFFGFWDSNVGHINSAPFFVLEFYNWAVLSDEQMSNGRQFSLLNDEQMSNWLGVEHQSDKLGSIWNYRLLTPVLCRKYWRPQFSPEWCLEHFLPFFTFELVLILKEFSFIFVRGVLGK